jgi:hypothetical protein
VIGGGVVAKAAVALAAVLSAAALPVLASVDTAGASAKVVNVAGTGTPGSSGVGGQASSARLDQPSGITLDGAGDLFIADTDNCRVDEVPAASGTHYGVKMTAHRLYVVAGSSCTGAHALGYPSGVAVDGSGNLYIADATGNRVLKVSASARSTPHVVAGTGRAGAAGVGGPAAAAQLDTPLGIGVDGAGNLFIADTENCRVDEVPVASGTAYGMAMTAGRLYAVAGSGTCGIAGLGGPATSAQLQNPTAVVAGANGNLLIADRGNGTVVELATTAGTYYGTAIGAGDLATVVGVGLFNPYLADGFAATGYASEVNYPYGLALASNGDLFMANTTARVVRIVPATTGTRFGRPMTAGDLYTVIGALPIGTGSTKTKWVTGHVTTPYGVAVDAAGNLYFSDRGASDVREVRT